MDTIYTYIMYTCVYIYIDIHICTDLAHQVLDLGRLALLPPSPMIGPLEATLLAITSPRTPAFFGRPMVTLTPSCANGFQENNAMAEPLDTSRSRSGIADFRLTIPSQTMRSVDTPGCGCLCVCVSVSLSLGVSLSVFVSLPP